MLHNKVNFGLISIASIIIISISYSRFGFLVTVCAVSISTVISYISSKTKSGNGNVVSEWFKWFYHLCNLCLCSTGLSHFLDYFDGNKSQDYIHFIPTTTMPHIMPIVVIIILCILFALGLEETSSLNILLYVIYLITFGLFILIGLKNLNFKVGFPEFQEDFISLLLPCTLLILPSYSEGADAKAEPISHTTFTTINYLVISTILYGLYGIKCKLYGLLCPLNEMENWYEPVTVILLSCCLALATYKLYLPTLKSLLYFGHKYFPHICKENQLTGTQIYAIFLIGCLCSLLVYLFSSYQLMMIGSSALIIGHCLDMILSLNNNHQPEYLTLKFKANRMSTLTQYKPVNTCETIPKRHYSVINKQQVNEEEYCEDGLLLSDDSGHSSETDIDAEVADYKERIKILNPLKLDNPQPSIQTGCVVATMLIFIVIFSYLASQALQNNQLITAVLLIFGIICWSFILYHQPLVNKQCNDDDDVNNKTKTSYFYKISTIICHIILIGTINSQIWFVHIIWLIIGCLFYSYIKYGDLCLKYGREKVKINQYVFKEMPIISIESEMVQKPTLLYTD